MPNALVAAGRFAVIALINHAGKDAVSLAALWNQSHVPRVILSGSLRLFDEVALHRRLKKESLRLKTLADQEAPGFTRSVLKRASEEALTGGALMAFRMVSQIKALVTELQPRAIIVTYEGHAWERMVFAAARSSHPKIRRLSYQHAALFRLQHAVRRNLSPEYNPDEILASGTDGKTQLTKSPALNGIPVTIIGSNRSFKKSHLDNEDLIHPSPSETLFNDTCLVLPEGIPSECHVLFEFSLACAQAFPDIHFIWRLHPIMTFRSLFAQNPRLRTLPANIVLSRAILEEDIARSGSALYRGTIAIVQAVVAGLLPIYLKVPGEMTIDPLYELKDWRRVVTTVSEFRAVLDAKVNIDPLVSKLEAQTAKQYCEDFFMPFDPKVIIDSFL